MLNMRACFAAEKALSIKPKIDFSGKDLIVSSKEKPKTKLSGWTQMTEIILTIKFHLECSRGGEMDKRMGAKIEVTMYDKLKLQRAMDDETKANSNKMIHWTSFQLEPNN